MTPTLSFPPGFKPAPFHKEGVAYAFVETNPTGGQYKNLRTDKLLPIFFQYAGPTDAAGEQGVEVMVTDLFAIIEGLLAQNQHLRAIATTPLPNPESIVSVTRFFRPRLVDPSSYFYWGEIDSRKGVTFKIVLDYDQKTITFGYAVCHDENFSKDEGKQLAAHDFQTNPKTIEMVDGAISKHGAVYDIYNHPAAKALLSTACRRQLKNALNFKLENEE